MGKNPRQTKTIVLSAFGGGPISETWLNLVCCVIQVNYTPFSKGGSKNQSCGPSLVNLHKPEKAAFRIRGWISPTNTSSSNIAMWDQICARYQMISATIKRLSSQRIICWSSPFVTCNLYLISVHILAIWGQKVDNPIDPTFLKRFGQHDIDTEVWELSNTNLSCILAGKWLEITQCTKTPLLKLSNIVAIFCVWPIWFTVDMENKLIVQMYIMANTSS